MATVKTRFYVRGRLFEVETNGYLTDRELLLIRLGMYDAFALSEQEELHPSKKEFIDAILVYSNSLSKKIVNLVVVY